VFCPIDPRYSVGEGRNDCLRECAGKSLTSRKRAPMYLETAGVLGSMAERHARGGVPLPVHLPRDSLITAVAIPD
jgi:hypothetical protein